MMKAGMNWMIMMNTIKKNPTKKVKDDEKAEEEEALGNQSFQFQFKFFDCIVI